MDQELQSYLHSLKQLYGLLQNDSSCSVSTMLDDNSRLLLKDLLDRACEDVFNIQDKKGKNCGVCQRPKLLAKTPYFATTNVTKSSALSVEGSGKLRSSDSFSKSSDAIKQIERRILEISDLSTRVQELHDRMNGIVLKPESASIVERCNSTSSENRKKAYGRLPSKRIARRAVEKNDKALIHGRDSKVVQKSVYAMRGLLKHVRRSKRSKPSAKRFSKYGKTSTAKLNWLKIFQHHKKAKKLGFGLRIR